MPGGWHVEGLPAIVRRAGPRAAARLVEFFTAQIRNANTRAAYGVAVDAVLHLVRRARARARPDLADRRGHLHRRAPGHR